MHHLGVTILVVVLTATIFSLLGFINAVFARNFDDISIIPTFVLTPLTYGRRVLLDQPAATVLADRVAGQPGPAHGQCLPLRYLGVSDIKISIATAFMIVATFVLYMGCARLLVSGRGMRQ